MGDKDKTKARGDYDIHANHRTRHKERYERDGMDGFRPHEVLELLLFYAIPRVDTNIIGHRLLKRFGSLAGVFEASTAALLEVKGIGPSAAMLIKMVPDLTRKYMTEPAGDAFLINSAIAGRHLVPFFMGFKEEHLFVVCLDAKMKVLTTSMVQKGNFNTVEINVKKVVSEALKHDAAGVIIAHNHPSGVALPSLDDNVSTLRVRDGLKAVGVNLCDHIIVADKNFVSYMDTYKDWNSIHV